MANSHSPTHSEHRHPCRHPPPPPPPHPRYAPIPPPPSPTAPSATVCLSPTPTATFPGTFRGISTLPGTYPFFPIQYIS